MSISLKPALLAEVRHCHLCFFPLARACLLNYRGRGQVGPQVKATPLPPTAPHRPLSPLHPSLCRLFGTTGNCAACSKLIPAFEMVMRARDNVYHLDCFACQLCNQR